MGCHFLLQGIFLTQGSNPGLPHCRQTLYRLSHQGIHPKYDRDLLSDFTIWRISLAAVKERVEMSWSIYEKDGDALDRGGGGGGGDGCYENGLVNGKSRMIVVSVNQYTSDKYGAQNVLWWKGLGKRVRNTEFGYGWVNLETFMWRSQEES